jgi:hypothetical protein
VQLHTKEDARLPVSRAHLLGALSSLPETTVDDCLRALRSQNRVVRVGRGLYEPQPWRGDEVLPSGHIKTTIFSNGNVRKIEWGKNIDTK